MYQTQGQKTRSNIKSANWDSSLWRKGNLMKMLSLLFTADELMVFWEDLESTDHI